MPRGGRRPGAGRKPKDAALRSIDGGANRRQAKVIAEITPAQEEAVPVIGDALAVPAYLDEPEAVAVWQELAPEAHKARTLTAATARSFSMLCRLVPLELKVAKIAPASAEHRGVLQRLNALMLQFNLTPCGKPLYEAKAPEKPKSGLSRFRSA